MKMVPKDIARTHT